MPANRLPGAAMELLPKDGGAGRFSASTQVNLGTRNTVTRDRDSLRTSSGGWKMTQSTAVTDGRHGPAEALGGHKLRNLRIVGGFLDGALRQRSQLPHRGPWVGQDDDP